MYDLETYELCFEEQYSGDYIKLKEVEQNSSGKYFAIAYFDDGQFYIRHFGRENRTPEEITDSELDINALIGIDNWTMVYQGFPDPSITCTFVTDTRIFINLFHNPTLTHYHFIYDIEAKAVIGKVVPYVIDSNKKNFPYKCFYNEDKDEIYSFYRQGEALTVSASDSSNFRFERMSDRDLG